MTGMRSTLALAMGVLALSAAHAQPGSYGRTITCESQDGRYNQCGTPFRSAPVLVEQLSSSPCIEGRTWGSQRPGSVWVDRGCRGRFADAYAPAPAPYPGGGHGAIRCESEDGDFRQCPAPGGGRMVLSRQLSQTTCVEGHNWGNGYGGVWVRGGCRGEFVPAGGGGGWTPGYRPSGRTITCSSENKQHNTCSWNPRWGRPYLAEQLSMDSCREGKSWGYDRGLGVIWVDRGCRARFSGN